MKYVIKNPAEGWVVMSGIYNEVFFVDEPEDATLFDSRSKVINTRGEYEWEVYEVTFNTTLTTVPKKSEQVIDNLVASGVIDEQGNIINPSSLADLIS